MLNRIVHKHKSKTFRTPCVYYESFDLSPFHLDFEFKRVVHVHVLRLVFTNKSKLFTAAAVMPC